MNNEIKILFLGDIVGKPGRTVVKNYLAGLLSPENENRYDFIIANAENASHGFGLTEKNHNELLEYGINCFTSGNHIWDKKDIFTYIENSNSLIRPANYPEGTPGTGYRIFDICDTKVAVVNLLGRTFMSPIDSPWDFINKQLPEIKKTAPVVIIDFHAEASAEKLCFAKYCSEHGVSAVLGTHTHVPTADEKILNNYTAYITDAGFCGTYDSIIGMEYQTSLKRLMTNLPARFDVAEGSVLELNAVSLIFDKTSGCAKNIERIRLIDSEADI